MGSKIIEIKTLEDLQKLNGWMIHSFKYDNFTLELVVSHIVSPDKVSIRISVQMLQAILIESVSGVRCYGYSPVFTINTTDLHENKPQIAE